ncbi:MAG TPA: SDR family oxidoreductase [Flavitalea sp.]|nr:SDR family oxidoreductase [Flavitalea sp.]
MKTVFITGVKGKIGRTIAEIFKAAGYFVIGQDKVDGPPDDCNLFYNFDLQQYVVDPVMRKDWNKKFERDFEKLHVLINNAAVQLLGDTKSYSPEEWNETLNVNLTAPFYLVQTFYDRLVNSKGSVINIASIHKQLTKQRFFAYATSKSALVGLTSALAVDVQGKFRVNSISPAAVDTPMLHEGFNNDLEKINQLGRLHPIQRIGRPEEVARLALFLSEDQTQFINGTDIMIDGGISGALRDLE